MRRQDRAVTSSEEIREILDGCKICRLGMTNGSMPYVVPLNFGYTLDNGALTLYFHCAKEGKKLDMLRGNPKVCFEMDCAFALLPGENACEYSARYRSIIGWGEVEILTEHAQKADGMRCFMRAFAPDRDFAFTPAQLEAVCVLRLRAEQYTGKQHI